MRKKTGQRNTATAKPSKAIDSQYPIRKDVPIPGNKWGTGDSKFPFKKMVLGDSFVVGADEALLVRDHMKFFNKKLRQANKPYTFKSRKLEGGSIGIWLLKIHPKDD